MMKTKGLTEAVLASALVGFAIAQAHAGPGHKPKNPVDESHASADPAADCSHFDRGTEILHNITEYYYSGKGLHAHFLDLEKVDANAAKNIAAARMKPGVAGCDSLQAAVTALGAAYDKEMKAVDDALPVCTTFPAAASNAGDCLKVADVGLNIDKGIRKDGGVLPAFIAAARAHPECTSLDMNSEEKLAGDTEEAVFTRLLKEPCERDDRCASARIGKLREARQNLQKLKTDGPGKANVTLTNATGQVIPMLYNTRGWDEGNKDAQPPETSGAENLLWHLTTYNSYWGGDAHDDNVLLFLATSKVAGAYYILKPPLAEICSGF